MSRDVLFGEEAVVIPAGSKEAGHFFSESRILAAGTSEELHLVGRWKGRARACVMSDAMRSKRLSSMRGSARRR